MHKIVITVIVLSALLPNRCEAHDKGETQNIFFIKKGVLPLLGAIKVYKNDSLKIGSLMRQDMFVYHNMPGMLSSTFVATGIRRHKLVIDKSAKTVFILVSYKFYGAFVVRMKRIQPAEFKSLYQENTWLQRLLDKEGYHSLAEIDPEFSIP